LISTLILKSVKKSYLYALAILWAEVSAQDLPHIAAHQFVSHWDDASPIQDEKRLRRELMAHSTTFLSSMEIHASTVKPGVQASPSHADNEKDKLLIVKAGKVKVTINDITKEIAAGSIAYVNTGDMFGVQNVGDIDAQYYILRFKSKLPVDKERGKAQGGSFIKDIADIPFKPHDKGGRRDYFNHATSQLAVFEMHTTQLNPGLKSHDPHTHVPEEIVLMIRGKVENYIDGKIYSAEAGDIIFYDSKLPHALHNVGTEPAEYFAFQWRN
jgi:(S)-ureidoglycine aminohydrolase